MATCLKLCHSSNQLCFEPAWIGLFIPSLTWIRLSKIAQIKISDRIKLNNQNEHYAALCPKAAQHALSADAAPLRFAAQVKRRPLGADGMNFEKDNAWLLGQVAWRGMLPAQVTFGR